MPPDRSSFTALNIPSPQIPSWMGSFSLSAPPNTDLWRKPPAQNISTAPILFTSLRQPFIAAEVTVSADWELEWDQGGLVIFAGSPQGHRSHPSDTPSNTPTTIPQPQTEQSPSAPPPPPPPAYASPNAPKWVKLGLEYTSGHPHASTVVATSDGADWCLSALPQAYALARRADLRIKMERIGYALWLWYLDDSMQPTCHPPPPPPPPPIYSPSSTLPPPVVYPPTHGPGAPQVVMMPFDARAPPPGYPGGALLSPPPPPPPPPPGVWRKLREVTWFFWGVEDKAVRVGVYACRPVAGGAGGAGAGRGGVGGSMRRAECRELCVEFEGLEMY
ncbi:hypothetical protein EJ05DRAFT_33180 [Pseudovirgaria hyperparasitica]|uniref:Uncharacterized protein n=1 Tax=Pseudovirgaria hyperparasitica TaxID=470096 RepID=A0A6A6WM66_9PEZI|nr:uncharacterized protein EJ05DRAFT_33180 [Pseudovirgaria hyperparasitica]KAF2763295.1 hypothetical protein EJ05DRAFT_33180 [Pseudovirgaria hyperparasitica]